MDDSDPDADVDAPQPQPDDALALIPIPTATGNKDALALLRTHLLSSNNVFGATRLADHIRSDATLLGALQSEIMRQRPRIVLRNFDADTARFDYYFTAPNVTEHTWRASERLFQAFTTCNGRLLFAVRYVPEQQRDRSFEEMMERARASHAALPSMIWDALDALCDEVPRFLLTCGKERKNKMVVD